MPWIFSLSENQMGNWLPLEVFFLCDFIRLCFLCKSVRQHPHPKKDPFIMHGALQANISDPGIRTKAAFLKPVSCVFLFIACTSMPIATQKLQPRWSDSTYPQPACSKRPTSSSCTPCHSRTWTSLQVLVQGGMAIEGKSIKHGCSLQYLSNGRFCLCAFIHAPCWAVVWLKISQWGLCFSSHQFLRRVRTLLCSSRGCGADAEEMPVAETWKDPVVQESRCLAQASSYCRTFQWPGLASSRKLKSPTIIPLVVSHKEHCGPALKFTVERKRVWNKCVSFTRWQQLSDFNCTQRSLFVSQQKMEETVCPFHYWKG